MVRARGRAAGAAGWSRLAAACVGAAMLTAPGCETIGAPSEPGALAAQATSNANVVAGNDMRAQDAVAYCRTLEATCSAAAPYCAAAQGEADASAVDASQAGDVSASVANALADLNSLRALQESLQDARDRYAPDFAEALDDWDAVWNTAQNSLWDTATPIQTALDAAGHMVFEAGRVSAALNGSALDALGAFDASVFDEWGGSSSAFEALTAGFAVQAEAAQDNWEGLVNATFTVPADPAERMQPINAYGARYELTLELLEVSSLVRAVEEASMSLDGLIDVTGAKIGDISNTLASSTADTARLADATYARAVEAQRLGWQATQACGRPVPASLQAFDNPFADPWAITTLDSTFWDFDSH